SRAVCSGVTDVGVCQLDQLELPPAVDDAAEQVGRALGVVDSRMRLATVEGQSGSEHGLAQHGLAIRQAGEAHRVEATERMERVALVSAAAHRLIEETQVERGVVADQDRPLAARLAHRLADDLEYVIQRPPFG